MDTLISVLVVLVSALFVLVNVGYFIYKKVNNLPTGECTYCRKGSKKLIKEYHKMYQKN